MPAVSGLNAVHVFGDTLRVNDLLSYPRVRLDRIPGWNTKPEVPDARDKAVGRPMREKARSTQADGKPLVYEGKIECQNQDQLEEYLDVISQVFSRNDEMVVWVYPYYRSEVFWYTARVTAFDPPEEYPDARALGRHTAGYERSFLLGLRMGDPRKYSADLRVATDGPMPGTEIPRAGGLTAPFTAPITATSGAMGYLYPPVTTVAGTIVVENGGAPSDELILTVTNRATGPLDIVNDTNGGRLTTSSVSDDVIVIDFRKRTITGKQGKDLTPYITIESTWWDAGMNALNSGQNYIRNFNQNGRMQVSYWPAYF